MKIWIIAITIWSCFLYRGSKVMIFQVSRSIVLFWSMGYGILGIVLLSFNGSLYLDISQTKLKVLWLTFVSFGLHCLMLVFGYKTQSVIDGFLLSYSVGSPIVSIFLCKVKEFFSACVDFIKLFKFLKEDMVGRVNNISKMTSFWYMIPINGIQISNDHKILSS